MNIQRASEKKAMELEGATRTELISNGRVVCVSEGELAELSKKCGPYGWFRYCQLRLNMSHVEALATIR